MKRSAIMIVVLSMFLVAGASEVLAGDMTRKNSEGKVTMRVTYENPGMPGPEFAMQMDTHSVDLDQYDLARHSVIVDKDGKEHQGKWSVLKGGGHHVSGKLSFEEVRVGKGKVVLIIRDVAGIKERKFEW